MKKIVFMTPPDARYGFSLSGVDQLIVQRAEVMEAMSRTARDATAGLIIIDERLIEPATQALLAELERNWNGVIVVLPAPEKMGVVAEDYAAQLIRRAIGYQVRLSV